MGDIMRPEIATCAPQTPLHAVAAMMAERRLHYVVVVDESDTDPRGWGVVSDLDLLAAALVRDLRDQTAAGSASRPMPTVTRDESIRRAAQLMLDHGVTLLLVTDPTSARPIGVLSTLDIAAALADPQQP